MPVSIVLPLFFITFFSSAELTDTNLLKLQPFVIIFPFVFLLIFLVIFIFVLRKFFKLPFFGSELTKKLFFMSIILSFTLFFLISDIGFYLSTLIHEIGHALAEIQILPKVYVYFSFPIPKGPYGSSTTGVDPIKFSTLPFFQQFIAPLSGVILEIIIFFFFSLFLLKIIWKKERPLLKENFLNFRNKLYFFIFPRNIRLQNNTFPSSPDLIRFAFYILVFSIFFNWLLFLNNSDIVSFFTDYIKWDGYLLIQNITSNPWVRIFMYTMFNFLIILSLTSLVFHQVDNLIIKNKKLYYYAIFAFVLFSFLIFIIHFHLANFEFQF